MSPLGGGFQGLKQFPPLGQGFYLCGSFLIRQHQHKALIVSLQIIPFHIPRIGQHETVIIVIIAVHLIDIHKRTAAVAEQFRLPCHALFPEQLYGLVQRIGPFAERHGAGLQFVHPGLNAPGIVLRGRDPAPGTDISAVSHSKLHAARGSRLFTHGIINGFQTQHGGRTHIGLVSHSILSGEKFQFTIPVGMFEQFPDLAVRAGQSDQPSILLLVFLRNLFISDSLGIFLLLSQYFYLHPCCPFLFSFRTAPVTPSASEPDRSGAAPLPVPGCAGPLCRLPRFV